MRYRPGGCTELGCADAPGTFGAAIGLGNARIVWHYQASDELRTFVVHYRLRGLAVAYDDVVDVNLKVWGSEWKEPLGRLTATETAPGKILRAWGHPVYVRGDVQLAGKRRSCGRSTSPPGSSSSSAPCSRALRSARRPGCGSPRATASPAIVAAEKADAAAFEKDNERIEHAKQHPWRYAAGPAPPRHDPGAADRRRRLLVLRARAEDAATTASTSRSRRRTPSPRSSRSLAAAGWRGGLVRVHRDALRPDPARRLHVEARDDRAGDLGRPAHARASPISRSPPGTQERRTLEPWENAVVARRRRRDRDGRHRAALALPRTDRGRPDVDEQALHVVQGERRRRRSATAAGSSRAAPLPLAARARSCSSRSRRS